MSRKVIFYVFCMTQIQIELVPTALNPDSTAIEPAI